MICSGWQDFTYDKVGDLSLGVMHRNHHLPVKPDPVMRYLLWVCSHGEQKAMLEVAASQTIAHREYHNVRERAFLIEVDRLEDIPVLLQHGHVHRVDECIRDGSPPRLVAFFRPDYVPKASTVPEIIWRRFRT